MSRPAGFGERVFGLGVALVLLSSLAACQTQADYEAEIRSRWQPYIGSTMGVFMMSSGLTPSNAFESATGRTFVVDGPAVTTVLPAAYGLPAIARTDSCRLMLETVNATNGRTADDWRIVSITQSGPCG
jgi:hypothetical protein